MRVWLQVGIMKNLVILLAVSMLFFGCDVPQNEDHDVAYCVDAEGNVVEEERCEEDSEHFNQAFLWIYMHHSVQPYGIGQRVPMTTVSRTPRENIPTYKASTRGTGTLRISPSPPKQAGWGVRPGAAPPKANSLPGRSVPSKPAPVRPIPVRPAPRGK